MINVVSYARVSSEEQAQKDMSIPAQKKAIWKYVESNPELNMVMEFKDEGISAYASADKRPGLCNMINYCKAKDIRYILVSKLDRFSRNREESIIFKSLLKKHGVQVKSISENFDPETPSGFLYEGMIEVINQFYSMNLATDTIKGMAENASRGYKNGGIVPYGYRFKKITDEAGRPHSVLDLGDPQEVSTIKTIFDLCVNKNMGINQICNYLNERKIFNQNEKPWSKGRVGYILNNPAYTGVTIWNKKGNKHRRINPENEWIVIENTHPAIIDKDLYEKRKQLASKRSFTNNLQNPHRHVNWLLSRLIKCRECGGNYVGLKKKLPQKRKNINDSTCYLHRYICGNYISKGRHICKSFLIDKEFLEHKVLDVIQQHISRPEKLSEIEEMVQTMLEERRRKYAYTTTGVETKIGNINRKIQNFYNALGEGLDPKVCKQKIEELEKVKVRLEKEAEILKKENYYSKALKENLQLINKYAATFKDNFWSIEFGEQRLVVEHFIDRIEIIDHKVAKIYFKIPFDNGEIKLLVDRSPKGKKRRPGGKSSRPFKELTDDRFLNQSGQDWLPKANPYTNHSLF